jgi:hypothetical protein
MQLTVRVHEKVVIVALANKLARIGMGGTGQE